MSVHSLIPSSPPHFWTWALETLLVAGMYLMVTFARLGASFPFRHFATRANSLPPLVFFSEKYKWIYKDLLVLKKKSRCRQKYEVMFTFCFFSVDCCVEDNYNWSILRSYCKEKWKKSLILARKMVMVGGTQVYRMWSQGCPSYPSWSYGLSVYMCQASIMNQICQP